MVTKRSAAVSTPLIIITLTRDTTAVCALNELKSVVSTVSTHELSLVQNVNSTPGSLETEMIVWRLLTLKSLGLYLKSQGLSLKSQGLSVELEECLKSI